MLNDRDDPELAWQRAVPLSAAWLKLASKVQRSTYQHGRAQRTSIQFTMIADLWERLAAAKLLALGVQTSPLPSRSPVYLPEFMFASAPPGLLADDTVCCAGMCFEHVRVLRRTSPKLNAPKQSAIATIPGPKPGRRNLYPLSAPILHELATELGVRSPSDWHHMPSAERLHERFSTLYRERYGSTHSPPPSERSLRTYLTTFQQELVEIGNNEVAG